MTGSGTQQNPYIIYNYADLNSIRNNTSAYYELANTVDCSDATWTPIPTFTGSLDGKGYSIYSLLLGDTPDGKNSGFFAELKGVVKDINFSSIRKTVAADSTVLEAIGIVAAIANQNAKLTRVKMLDCSITGLAGDVYLEKEILYIGGVFGQFSISSSTSNNITECVVNVTIAFDKLTNLAGSSTVMVGGVIGNINISLYSGNIVTKCAVMSDIFINANQYVGIYAGGIFYLATPGISITEISLKTTIDIYVTAGTSSDSSYSAFALPAVANCNDIYITYANIKVATQISAHEGEISAGDILESNFVSNCKIGTRIITATKGGLTSQPNTYTYALLDTISQTDLKNPAKWVNFDSSFWNDFLLQSNYFWVGNFNQFAGNLFWQSGGTPITGVRIPKYAAVYMGFYDDESIYRGVTRLKQHGTNLLHLVLNGTQIY